MKTVYYDRRSILTGRLNTDIFRLTFDLYLDFQFLTNHGHDQHMCEEIKIGQF